jgi:hypothetical protein
VASLNTGLHFAVTDTDKEWSSRFWVGFQVTLWVLRYHRVQTGTGASTAPAGGKRPELEAAQTQGHCKYALKSSGRFKDYSTGYQLRL